MKNFNISKCFLIVGFLLANSFMYGQTPAEKKEILDKTDLKKLDSLKQVLVIKNKAEKSKAIAIAKATNQPITRENPNGGFDELMGVLSDGSLYYYSLDNVDAAISTRANYLNSGGGLGLNLNGENMLGGIWDGGPVRTSHIEFGGRISVGDGAFNLNENSFHMTHVTGTVGAKGIDPAAKGMANQTEIITFDWTDDNTEVIDQITSSGLLLSNHSYGVPANNSPSWLLGAYSTNASIWDEIAHAAPYYLMVTSAGNNGNFFNTEATTPFFDKLTTEKNAKNNLVIANANDASIDSSGNLVFVQISSSSTQGPTDDNRIKPDITGNGTGLYSTNSNSNVGYTTLSGTSMSGPNVMGTLLLLQQYHNELYENFMLSATLKGLACHTADDAGNPGPDATFGWGLLNAKKAAETLNNNGFSTWVSEEVLTQDETFTMTVKATGSEPLIASITWTDLAGEPINGELNNTSPRLVQDLDIRVSNGNNTFFPWKLQASADQFAIRSGDNSVDNVEQVKIDNPLAQDYTITITHKGNLIGNKQAFSLVVTGVTSNFTIRPKGNDFVQCSDDDFVIPFDFITSTTENVTFEAINLPENVTAVFSSESSSVNASLTLTLENLDNAPAGDYEIGIVASSLTESETRYLRFKILSPIFENINYISPLNGQSGVGASSIFSWESQENAENYVFQLSNSPNFNTILFQTNLTATNFTYANLVGESIYYWRVLPSNRCDTGSSSNFSSFQTGFTQCGIDFVPTDFSNSIIESVANSQATIPVNVNQDIIVSDLKVFLDVTHTWVQDLTVYIQGPESIGSPIYTLIQEPCGEEDDFVATFTDGGQPLSCSSNPAFSGNIIPLQSLSNFSGLPAEGIWNIIVLDNYNQDGGSIDNAFLSFCNVTAQVANIDLINNEIVTAISTDKVILNTEILTNSVMLGTPSHFYTLIELPEFGTLLRNGTSLAIGDVFTQAEVNQGALIYSNTLTEPTNDSFKVDINNLILAWLPNQTINIVINETLAFDDFESENLKVYPNPSTGIVNISAGLFWLDAEVTVYDLTGRLILQKTVADDQISIDLSNHNDGLYLVLIEKEGHKSTHKISINR
uniref:S8 family serine peptidase n=2 Tax=Flavobacterium sp. TaxID=239 RepID=UPI00404B1752